MPKILAAVLLAALTVLGVAAATPASAQTAAAAPAVTGATGVSGGGFHACATVQNGQVRCWGANGYGQLGIGSTGGIRTRAVLVRNPAGTGPLTGVTTVTTGEYHTCALLQRREVLCWGLNSTRQLGTDTAEPHRALPAPVVAVSGTGPLRDVVQIDSAGSVTCARLASGQARCWGPGDDHRLGNGTTTSPTRPVVVTNPAGTSPLGGLVALDTGKSHTCAVRRTTNLVCWGENRDGELGIGTTDAQPRPVTPLDRAGLPLTGVRAVGVGDGTACVVLGDSSVRCWGEGAFGRLGNGAFEDSLVPVPVVTGDGARLRGAVAVSLNVSHACASLSNGQVRCWGENDYGRLGRGASGPDVARAGPVLAASGPGPLTGVTRLSSGSYHTCARVSSGQLRCWGQGLDGQLGNGGTAARARPVPVTLGP